MKIKGDRKTVPIRGDLPESDLMRTHAVALRAEMEIVKVDALPAHGDLDHAVK
jgi:hypothetical protein